jgi:hypothetical protein
MEAAFSQIITGLPGWHKNEKKRKGRWRFLAFSVGAGESGDTMLHKFRTALGLAGNQYKSLFIYKSDLLREQLCAQDNIVLIDDFAGTGKQACNAWRDIFAELLPGNPKTYLMVIAAGQRAVDRINQETKLRVAARYILGSDDDIFSEACRHFTQQDKDRLAEYCSIANSQWPRGYGDCGFVLVLAHRTPNNSIPVLYAEHRRWKGLFPRY